MARVHIVKETNVFPGDWKLFFQWCRYEMDDDTRFGYRFIWRRPDGSLQAARGQARLPSVAEARALMDRAVAEGWGDRDWEKMKSAKSRLESAGCVVDLTTGYVGWPNKAAATVGNLTPEMIDDTHLIREWS